jgi:hypothetical protein
MTSITARFREVEVTLDAPAALPAGLPATWLNLEQSGVVVRFTDTHFDDGRWREEVPRRFASVRNVQAREMNFRAIFLALAHSRRQSCA